MPTPRIVASVSPLARRSARSPSQRGSRFRLVSGIAATLRSGIGHGGNSDDQRLDLSPVEPYRTVRQNDVGKSPLPSKTFGTTRLPTHALVEFFREKKHAWSLRKYMGKGQARIAF